MFQPLNQALNVQLIEPVCQTLTRPVLAFMLMLTPTFKFTRNEALNETLYEPLRYPLRQALNQPISRALRRSVQSTIQSTTAPTAQ